jgi:4-alpha-glucanotransferase
VNRPLPAGVQRFPRAAGVVVPLFSLRGAHDAGTGEILDLIPFIDWLDSYRQRVVQLLPINEAAPGEPSPYNALSAFAIDPTYISTSGLVDVVQNAAAQEWLSAPSTRQRLRRLSKSRHRNRRVAYAYKLRLLELAYEEFEHHAASTSRGQAFDRFCQRNACWLHDYALFRALKERQRWTSWETWPPALRWRDAPALERVAATLRSRIRFFQYVQWIAAQQWDQVREHARARGVLLNGDLPFTCGRDSADTWAHAELFDLSSSAGAPPDEFSPTGQAWGLPLYDWTALRRSGYAWWRQRARQAGELYDLFRVDHVVGLYRTYAIPVQDGGTSGFVPPDEADQLTQGHEVLTAILEEATEAAAVVAEDLGTVPPWVRASLTELGIPGYKVLRWEKQASVYSDPRSYPSLSVATSGTHDTNTLSAWWDELPADEREALLQSVGVLDAGQANPAALTWPAIHTALLRRLYEAGSLLTILPIQDLFGWRERINTPATVDRRNWTYRLPVAIDQLEHLPAIREHTEAICDMIYQSGRYTEV